ncbi:unnamed protein product [Somion occarium]|uniref:Uncharacterized protein n=1 Tax=Somion occarium TaxID=3059160 RepID=A0ABP1DJ72_9APHY
MAENEDYAELNHALNEWLNFWRMLIHNIGVVAMDLGNHPDDRLATHVWVLELERRPEAATPVHLFKLTKASIMSREEVAQLLREKETSEEDVQEWVNDNRGDHTLHTAVFVEDHVRFMWVSFRSLVDYKSNPEESRRKAIEGVESLTSAMNGMPGSEGNVAGAGPALLH